MKLKYGNYLRQGGYLFVVVCWPDCKPEGPLFSAEFVCLSVCLSLTGTSTLQRRPILIKRGHNDPILT